MKIELTIKTDYLPSWGLWEGVRELVQNARDAEFELDSVMTVDYVKDTQTLRICNTGTKLPIEALLLGHTTKVGRSDTIGKFGEGLKLGILALVRDGYPVKIRSGSEVWVPEIVESEKFGGAKVLCFDIKDGRKDEDRVRVEVKNVSEESWGEFQKRFLFLDKDARNNKDRVPCPSGELLLAPEMQGLVYVKGIWVENTPDLRYGYNLTNADLDRDRRMVERWSRNYSIRRVWTEALELRPDLVQRFVGLLDMNAPDVEGLSGYALNEIPKAATDAIVAEFHTRHGADAVPVSNIGESKDLEHLGRAGIVVPEKMQLILSGRLGSVETIKAELRNEVTTRFGWHDLDTVERANLETAVALVAQVDVVTLADVSIVAFRSPSLMGQFKDGKVLISRALLKDRGETIATLVHEVAHRDGGDGEHAHVANIERIWTAIVERLLGKQ